MRDASELLVQRFSPIDWHIKNWDGFFKVPFKEFLIKPVRDPEMILIDKFFCLSYKLFL